MTTASASQRGNTVKGQASAQIVGEHPTQTALPGDDLKPAWRAACIAYREVRRTGQLDQPAWVAARVLCSSPP